jgi:hypothetical protein
VQPRAACSWVPTGIGPTKHGSLVWSWLGFLGGLRPISACHRPVLGWRDAETGRPHRDGPRPGWPRAKGPPIMGWLVWSWLGFLGGLRPISVCHRPILGWRHAETERPHRDGPRPGWPWATTLCERGESGRDRARAGASRREPARARETAVPIGAGPASRSTSALARRPGPRGTGPASRAPRRPGRTLGHRLRNAARPASQPAELRNTPGRQLED